VRLVLDSGVFVAVDRGDRDVAADLSVAQAANVPLLTSASVVAQVWRDGPRQARLARLLSSVEVHGLSPDDAKELGLLLGANAMADVVDAHVASLARAGDQVLTSDPDDISRLVATRSVRVTVQVI
jgi:hypothetical protein